MKTHRIILSLIVMAASLSVFADETRFFTNFAAVDANGALIFVTNENIRSSVVKPHEMLLEVTHHQEWRSDSGKPATNGTILVRASGPYQSKGYPHWVAPFGNGVFKVCLRDERGVLANPTELGKRLGKAPATVKEPLYNQPVLFFYGTNQPVELTHFDIDDMFFIVHSGMYNLKLTPQLYWQVSAGLQTLYLTNLPAIELAIPLKSNMPP